MGHAVGVTTDTQLRLCIRLVKRPSLRQSRSKSGRFTGARWNRRRQRVRFPSSKTISPKQQRAAPCWWFPPCNEMEKALP